MHTFRTKRMTVIEKKTSERRLWFCGSLVKKGPFLPERRRALTSLK